jgi:deoxyguanosine kinase
MISRFKQQLDMPQPDLFHAPVFADYIFQKDRIFASITLDDNELDLYNLVCGVMEPRVQAPELVVYLQASTARLHDRIKKRGRDYERNISSEYLDALNNAYNDFLFHYRAAPVFIVNTDDIDFVDSSGHFDDLAKAIAEPHTGITFYNPRGLG